MGEPVSVLGITEADYNSWKHNPVTKMFHQYLRHFAGSLEEGHLLRWKNGAMEQGKEDECVGRVLTLNEMAELEFASIVDFYNSETEQQEQDETTDLRDPAGEV
jgi:hypothetical protein